MLKYRTLLIGLIALFASCQKNHNTAKQNDFAIIIHGGAGTILKENMTPEKEEQYKAVLAQAVNKGYEILESGGSSVDAVEQTIIILENSPLFNAGKGAVFTHEGTHELDASIMTGHDLDAGAVAAVQNIKNPISLARKIMEESPHLLLSGKGAFTFAKSMKLDTANAAYFFTQPRYDALLKAKEEMKIELDHDSQNSSNSTLSKAEKFGTVGCVALDKMGNLTAGTSTGGMTNKKWNRIGDTPIIGSGTYANNETCGVSSTGWGEYFIRAQVAHDISALLLYKNMTLNNAAKKVIQEKLTQLGGSGGIVAIDKYGNMVAEFNTPGMYRASMDDKGNIEMGIYK